MDDASTFFDGLSEREGLYCEAIIRKLSGEHWADSLLRAIANAGGVCRSSKSFLFELRFANALHGYGIRPEYEIPGVGGSTIDFGFASKGRNWVVELMRLEETAAVQGATHSTTDKDGVQSFSRMLSSRAKDQKQSEEGETLKAIERICQKCEKEGAPHKFPAPKDSFHVILVDFRTFLNGGDKADRIHVGLGGRYLRNGFFRRFWKGKLITGVFDDATNLRGAQEARDRVHFIGFVNEREYEADAFSTHTQFIANPYLFKSMLEVQTAIDAWPLQPAQILNIGAE